MLFVILLIQPDFCSPWVTAVTGFHSIIIHRMQSRLPPCSLNLPGKTYLLWERLEAPLTDETLRKRKDGKRQLVAEVKEEGEVVVVVVVGVAGVGEEEEERARPKRYVRNHM